MNNQPNTPEPIEKKEEIKTISGSKPPRPRRSHRIWWLLAIILIIGLLFDWFQLYRYSHRTHKELQTLNKQATSLQNQLTKSDKLINQQKKVIEANQTILNQLSKVASGSKDIWVLSESEYLIRMAILSLDVQHNISTAIALLNAADHRLKNIVNTKAITIRKVLANDIAKLKAVTPVDYTGIYLRLSALDDQVMHLPIALPPPVEKPKTIKATSWQKGWDTTWDTLKEVVIIRHHKLPVRPLLTLQERKLIDVNLHALFAQAQWALLQHNKTVYQNSLNKAEEIIHQYFIGSQRRTESMLKETEALQKIDISPKLPNIDNVLALFHHHSKENKKPNKKKATGEKA